jgi:hypothetical protein
MAADFQLFFSEVGLGWAEMNLSITRVIATAEALLKLDWDKIDKIWNGGSKESRGLGIFDSIIKYTPVGRMGDAVGWLDAKLFPQPKSDPNSERPITINIEVDGKTITQKAVMRPDGSYYVPPRP